MKPIKQTFFNQIANEFDTHVRQSIPLFNEYVEWLTDWIVEFYPTASVLDICGSTGAIGRILHEKGFGGTYVNLDGSPKMIEVADCCKPDSDRYENVLGGFMCGWIDDSGVPIEMFEPQCDFDIVIEHLGFQFFTQTRRPEIEYIKGNLLKKDGIFITCEKFTQDRQSDFIKYEIVKDELHKSRSFSKEEIARKKESVLADMNKMMVNMWDFYNMLGRMFFSRTTVYRAGNFAAYICTNRGYIHIPNGGKDELYNNRFNHI